MSWGWRTYLLYIDRVEETLSHTARQGGVPGMRRGGGRVKRKHGHGQRIARKAGVAPIRSKRRVCRARAAILTLFLSLPATAVEMGGEPILPLPQAVALNPDKVALGETLFHDARVARNDTMACASCHNVMRGGDAGISLTRGNQGQPDPTNAPTVFNASFNASITWRGAFRTLTEHTDAEIQNPNHANMTWSELIAKLGDIPDYIKRFRSAYGNSITRANIIDAIVTYEQSLITPNSRFDRYLRGERNVLSAQEQEGYALFKSYGCIACHQGMNVGGNVFQRLGVFENYFRQRKVSAADFGRFNVTQREQDRHVFRVPSLRNVAVTAPYFHDGSVLTLSDAIAKMGRMQLGREIPPKDNAAIAAFLSTLTGEYRGRRLDAPGKQP